MSSPYASCCTKSLAPTPLKSPNAHWMHPGRPGPSTCPVGGTSRCQGWFPARLSRTVQSTPCMYMEIAVKYRSYIVVASTDSIRCRSKFR